MRWGGEGIPKCLACIPRSKHMAQKACVCVCIYLCPISIFKASLFSSLYWLSFKGR